MKEIKKVAVLGANGNMGSLSGGIFAQAGVHCLFFARTKEKAEKGLQNAVGQARSSVLSNYIECLSYDELEKHIPECDWIFEALGENLQLKKEFYTRIDKCRKQDSVISSVSSGLSIEEMAEGTSENFQQNFLGTHFYNPPSKLIANELIFHTKNTQEFCKKMQQYCKTVLGRKNIIACNVPAFAGNRIGFQFLNEAAIFAEKHGVEKIDYLLGSYTGRAMPPLRTIDLVGFDVHKAIVDNIYEKTNDEMHKSFQMPKYMQTMIDNQQLGNKTPANGGFYKKTEDGKKLVFDANKMDYRPFEPVKVDFVEQIKEHIHNGRYRKAIEVLKSAKGEDAGIVKGFISMYIFYSFAKVGDVTPKEEYIHGIDDVMSFGFSWLAPSAWVDFLGGKQEAIHFLKESKWEIPQALENAPSKTICKIVEPTRFLLAR